MKQIYISPSKLTFLLNECRRCFYLDAHKLYTRPFSPFPSVFTLMDKQARAYFDGRVAPGDRPNQMSTKALRKKSLNIPGTSIGFSGEIDCLIWFDDGTIGISDFKVASKMQHASSYNRQLGAYRYMFENPLVGSPAIVSELSLTYLIPEAFSGEAFKIQTHSHVIDYPRTEFESFAKGIADLLVLPLDQVPFDPTCPHCVNQKLRESQNV
jgi:hypothetical protein